MKNVIDSCKYLLEDMQIENILDIYELRQDASKEEKHKRTAIQDILDIKHNSKTMRRMKFPGFNIRLSQDQYKKLFENIPLRHRKGRKKRRFGVLIKV